MRRRLLGWAGVLCIALAAVPARSAYAAPTTLGFTFSPSSGPPGTRVQFEGDIPPSMSDFSAYQMSGFAYGLEAISVPTNPANCELIVGLQQVDKAVIGKGHVTGSFVVGDTGGCFMSPTNVGSQPARPGVYAVLLSCHACTPAGTFTITSSAFAVTGSASLPLAGTGAGLLVIGLALAGIARRRVERDALI